MKLDLSEIAKTPGMQAVHDVDEQCPNESALDCVSAVKGQIRISNTGSLLLVKGEVKAEVRLECSRCTTDFVLPVEADVEEEFRLEKVGDAIQVLPIDEEETTPDLMSGSLLDVQELIRQNLLPVLPIQPLCKPDCKGLCPTCGENLNVGKCQCPPAESESPFGVLADLLEEENRS